jgi:hypothetical protein
MMIEMKIIINKIDLETKLFNCIDPDEFDVIIDNYCSVDKINFDCLFIHYLEENRIDLTNHIAERNARTSYPKIDLYNINQLIKQKKIDKEKIYYLKSIILLNNFALDF